MTSFRDEHHERLSSEEGSRDLVEQLVRLAQTDAEVPLDGAARVKHAVRPLWRAQIRARAWRRRLFLAAGVAAAACLTIVVFLHLHRQAPALVVFHPAARVAAVAGELEIATGSGDVHTVTTSDLGLTVMEDAVLRTSAHSRASVLLSTGHSLRLDTDTDLHLTTARALELRHGAVYLDIARAGSSSVEVWTPLGVARDIGTQFEVRLTGTAVAVGVREGDVILSHDSTELRIPQGTRVTVEGDGSHHAVRLAADAGDWDWVQEVAPGFTIEDRTLLNFLDWVSREAGLVVRYHDAATEQLARSTRLHGSIDGLTPTQAVEAVLPGCGLEHHRGNGVLTIARP